MQKKSQPFSERCYDQLTMMIRFDYDISVTNVSNLYIELKSLIKCTYEICAKLQSAETEVIIQETMTKKKRSFFIWLDRSEFAHFVFKNHKLLC